MHYLVRLIVEADSAEEANSQADSVMMDLIEWREFDWYHTEADDSRWEDCWKPMRLTEKKAQTLLQDAMRWQFDEFKNALATIRLMIDNYTDEQIFNEKFKPVEGHHLSRYHFGIASGYHGAVHRIFGEGSEPIISQEELDYHLKNRKDLWLVLVDCHA